MTNNIFVGNRGQITANYLVLDSLDGTEPSVVPATSGSWAADGVRFSTRDITDNTSLLRSDSGKTILNSSAVVGVTAYLPEPSGAGLVFNFVVVSNNYIRVTPRLSNGFVYSSGVSTDGKYLELSGIGSRLSVISNEDDNWIAISENGSITEEA